MKIKEREFEEFIEEAEEPFSSSYIEDNGVLSMVEYDFELEDPQSTDEEEDRTPGEQFRLLYAYC